MPICLLPWHCYMSSNSLCLCCESKVHTSISQWVCMPTHLNFFVEGVSCIFYCCCSPGCIKLELYTLIRYSFCSSLRCNHHLYYFSNFIFFLILLFCFTIVLYYYFVNCPFLQDSQIFNKGHYMWSRVIHW
jgi:hypothetical protein